MGRLTVSDCVLMEQETLNWRLRQQLQAFLAAALPAHQHDLLLIFDRAEIGGPPAAQIAKFCEFEHKLPRPWSSLHKPRPELRRDCAYMLRVGRMAVFAALRFLEHAHEYDDQETEAWLYQLRFDSADDGCQGEGSTSASGRKKRKPKSEHPVRDVLLQHREQTLLFAQLVRSLGNSVDKGSKQLTIDGCRVLCGQFLHPDLPPNKDGCFRRYPCTTPGGGGSPLTRVGEAIYCACTGAPIDSRPKRSEGGKRTNRPKQWQLQPFTRPAPVQAAVLEELNEQHHHQQKQHQHQQQCQRHQQPYAPSVLVEADFRFNQAAPLDHDQSFEQLMDNVLEAIRQLASYQQHMQHQHVQQMLLSPTQVPHYVPEMVAPPYPMVELLSSDEVAHQLELDDDDWSLLETIQWEDVPALDESPAHRLSHNRDSLQLLASDPEYLSSWSLMFDEAEAETSHNETPSASSSPVPPSSPSLSSLNSDGATSPTSFLDFPDHNPAKRARLDQSDVFEMSPVLSLP